MKVRHSVSQENTCFTDIGTLAGILDKSALELDTVYYTHDFGRLVNYGAVN